MLRREEFNAECGGVNLKVTQSFNVKRKEV